MAYGPGVNEINYSDLPPIGDTVNSAFQKTQNQLDTLYTGLNSDLVRASEAEVNTATDTTKLITPGTLLKGKVNGVASLNSSGKVTGTELPLASSTTKGIIELATSAEVLAGTDGERAVTPATLTAKILGTVSQVGGVPTGAIIENGSNANGYYYKFANGLAICYRTLAWTGNETFRPAYTLPMVFSGGHVIPVGVYVIAGSEIAAIFTSVMYKSSSEVYCWVYDVTNSVFQKRASALTCEFIIIGRWY